MEAFEKWFSVKQTLVPILVVVANIQVRTLKTEVEKGSMWTVIEHGLVDPKIQGNSIEMFLFFKKKDRKIVERESG
jgi:hypothetical protein